jgi:curli biogenesis system outer membrane secretion channel CsgG
MSARTTSRVALAAVACTLLAACNTLPTELHAEGEAPVIKGTPSRANTTPLEPAFACLANAMRAQNAPVLSVAVGDVKDYTGKYSQNEGNAITQGGALMIYSALGKMGGAVQLQERFDTRIAELELAYTEKRQLGDGRQHAVEPGKPAVPWVPYYGGSILRSTYYIIGGITEVNYGIATGGAEFNVDGVGLKRRTFTMNVGVDLRIVDTRTLVVARTVSLQKQVIGEEAGLGVFRFFGDRLVDLNAGAKNQEPLQLGVRTAIEHGVLELIASVAGVDIGRCVDASGMPTPARIAQASQPAPAAAPAAPVVAPAAPADAAQAQETTRAPENMGGATGGITRTVPFEVGSASITAGAASMLERIAAEALQNRQVTVQVLARDIESRPPAQRVELTNQRVKAATDFLAGKGVSPQRIRVTWTPDPTDPGTTRHSPGYQLLATLVVAP